MRILFVASFSGIGGAERSLLPLAQELVREQHALTLFLTRSPENSEVFAEFAGEVDFPDRRESTGRMASWKKKITRFWQLAQRVRATDVVIATSELTPTYVAYLLSILFHRPLVADVQVQLSKWIQDNCHPAHRWISRWVYRRIRAIRCVSEGVAADLREKFKVPAEKLIVIPVPFDLQEIRRLAHLPLSSSEEALITTDHPIIVSAGRLTDQKRFDVALHALDKLRRAHGIRARLLILGEGENLAALESLAVELGLEQDVFMPGFIPNPFPFLRRAGAFLLSSDYEGFGRVLVDALIVGCPVVSTDCPSGPAEVLEGGISGLLVRPGDPAALAAALARVFTEPNLADHLRTEGAKRVEAFSASQVNLSYQKMLIAAQS